MKSLRPGLGAAGRKARRAGAVPCPLTPQTGQARRAQEGLLSSWPEQGFPDQERTGYPGLLPQLCLRQRAQPCGAADSSSHTHAGPGPSRPDSSFLGRKPSSAWVVTTILPFHSRPHQVQSSLSAPVSDPARAAAGTVHPSSRGCDQPLATQPRLPLPPQLEARCPQESGQFRESRGFWQSPRDESTPSRAPGKPRRLPGQGRPAAPP